MKKVKIYALALVLVLSCLGVSYAAWSDELVVEGSVETGDIDVYFSDFDVVYDADANTKDDEEVATVSLVSVCEDDKELKFEIDNAYPQFMANIEFEVHNQGSIPVKLQSVDIDAPGELEVENAAWWCRDCGNWKWKCECEPEEPELEVGTQLNTCDRAEGSIGVEVSPDCSAEQGETYTFTVTYDFIQWNKYEE